MNVDKMDEQILVIKRDEIFDYERLSFDGFTNNKDIVNLFSGLLHENIEVMRRGDAESNPKFKQPITYAVLRRGNKIFTYSRLKGGGESRLHGQLSIGVGGHMNKIDDTESFKETLIVNLQRELDEEVDIRGNSDSTRILGFINDDSDDVGQVHLGVLFLIDLPEKTSLDVKETDQLDGDWLSLDELQKDTTFNRLENWSQIALKTLS